MKLHVVFEMDLEEKGLRKVLHTNDAHETAIALKSFMCLNIEEGIKDVGAENVKVDITLKE